MTTTEFNETKFITATRRLFADCLMPNGGIVAAPTHQPYYPKDAASYMSVWPGRDVGFALAAMLLLGDDHYELFLRWLWERAEDVQTSPDPTHKGLLFRNYYVNGRIFLHFLQPDQNGTLLWSIAFKQARTGKPLSTLEKKVMTALADGLVRIWDRDRFVLPVEDLWEERGLRPGQGMFTYSLAACAVGLEAAGRLLGRSAYHQTSAAMKAILADRSWDTGAKIIRRRIAGSLGSDTTPDGSLAGLVWPFNAGFDPAHLRRTLERIEGQLLTDRGVRRYPADRYEGSLGDGHNHTNDMAGAWPILTFWLSIAWSELGDRKRAERYFSLMFEKLGDDYLIPEQLFCCHLVPWVGVKPLLWSHAMALFAAEKLGFLQY
ncbi:MAG: hypothetical protein HY567_02130 [Candidatus Kerfeldbacteria bacterium]|nr:hypothetical protein [Candidatus Kerfeldbacteria bacterium]